MAISDRRATKRTGCFHRHLSNSRGEGHLPLCHLSHRPPRVGSFPRLDIFPSPPTARANYFVLSTARVEKQLAGRSENVIVT